MIQSRLGFQAIIVSGFLFGLMAFAVDAQAEAGAKWRVNGADIGSLEPQLSFKEIENKSASVLFVTKSGTHVLFLCTTAEFDEGFKLIANGGISLGRILFKGCSAALNEAPASNCTPRTEGKALGEILTLKINGLIVLDKETSGATTELVKFTPDVGIVFADILVGVKCAIGEELAVEASVVGGGAWIKDAAGNAGFLTESVTHLVQEGLLGLKILGQPARIVGSAVIDLCCVHNGLKWSGVPA